MSILVSEPVLAACKPLRELLESIEQPAFLRAHCEAIEQARLDAELKRANIQRRLAETQLKQVMRSPDPQETVALQRRVRELTERVADLEQDLEGGAALEEQVRVLEGTVAQLQAEAQVAATQADPAAPMRDPDARAEHEAWQTLLAQYLPLLEGALPCAEACDPLSLPCPLDLHGILREAGTEQQDGEPSVDVVVCVHDALKDVRECLHSLLAKSERPLRLILVNDGSNEPTCDFLRAFVDRHPTVTLIHRKEPPHGYTLAANLGIEASQSDYVVLLNSDTVLTPGWLRRMVACGESHEDVGILGPLSNAASHQSVPSVKEGSEWSRNPLPSWLTVDGMGVVVAQDALCAATPLPFLNGFCYAIKRAVIETIGLLDEEHFAEGYCEENDYSLRAREAGFELAVVDDAYVYHSKSRSYGAEGRAELARANYETFLEKHGREQVQAEVAKMEADDSFAPVRAAVAQRIATPRASVALLNGPAGEPLSVAFLLPGLAHGGSGGSHSLYQETRALRSLGIPARIMLPRWDGERAAAVL